jgi:hypothetical protein
MKLTSWRGWRQFDENSPIQQLPGMEDISRSGNINIRPNGDEPMSACSCVEVERDSIPNDRDSDIEHNTDMMSVKILEDYPGLSHK